MKINKMLVWIIVIILSCVLAIAYSFSAKSNAQTPSNPVTSTANILVNQVGYYPKSPKTALFINFNTPESSKAQLVNNRTKHTVFETNLGTPQQDLASQDRIQSIDFSKFNKEGFDITDF